MHLGYTSKGMHTNKTSMQSWKHIQMHFWFPGHKLLTQDMELDEEFRDLISFFFSFLFFFFLINNTFHKGDTKSVPFFSNQVKITFVFIYATTVTKKKKKIN